MTIVDSPLVDEDAEPEAVPMYAGLWKATDTGWWRIWRRDMDQEQAVAGTLVEAEEMLIAAKKKLRQLGQSNGGGLAAVGLRIFASPTEEL